MRQIRVAHSSTETLQDIKNVLLQSQALVGLRGDCLNLFIYCIYMTQSSHIAGTHSDICSPVLYHTSAAGAGREPRIKTTTTTK